MSEYMAQKAITLFTAERTSVNWQAGFQKFIQTSH